MICADCKRTRAEKNGLCVACTERNELLKKVWKQKMREHNANP